MSDEKCDVFALTITALCLLFPSITAKNLSDLKEGQKKYLIVAT